MKFLDFNLISAGYASIAFVLAYASNVLFSLYYNIAVRKEKFSVTNIFNSILKVFVFISATLLLVLAVDIVLSCFTEVIPVINDLTKNTVTILMIFSSLGKASLKYITEAYYTFTSILSMDNEVNHN